MKAIAYNNDVTAMIVIEPDNDSAISNCLGFAITRIDQSTNTKLVLPNHIAPNGVDNSSFASQPSNVWPIQDFVWRDYSVELGHSYVYEVVALGGSFDNLSAIAGMTATTNVVNVTTEVGDYIKVAFTRGILATQWMARNCPKLPNGDFDFDGLTNLLKTPGNPIRDQLMGNVKTLLEEPVLKAAATNGHVYQALYEFTDPELLAFLVQYAKDISIILGSTGNNNQENQQASDDLTNAGAEIYNRTLVKTSIPHNKCQASVDANGNGVMVSSGAVNWTTTGMCTQSSNVINIMSAELANLYVAQWNLLKDDTVNDNSEQGPTLRQANGTQKPLVTLPDGTTIQVWFSPNTDETMKPKNNPATPPDMAQVFAAIQSAKNFVGSLLFIPGYPAVTSEIVNDYPNMNGVMFRVAVSDKEALPWNLPTLRAGDPPLFVVADAITSPFADYVKEFDLLPDAFAIIHSKYVVVDPLGQAVVVTGSHNLGFKASYQNDENLLIITGNKRLAMYYMVDNLDVYDHYLFNQRANAGTITGVLASDDSWQADKLTGSNLSMIQYLASGNYPA